MNHRELVEKLHDFHFGEFGDTERAEIEEHLGGCPECRSLSETYVTLHHAIEAKRGATSDHPSPEDVVQLALFPDGLDDEVRQRVDSHVGKCASCTDEVIRIRESEASATAAAKAESRGWATRLGLRGPGGMYALAASLLAAALLYPAFVGLYRYPELRQRTTELNHALSDTRDRAEELGLALEDARADSDRATAWSGPVDVVFLSSALRDEVSRTEVLVDLDRPHVVFGVEFDVPRRASDSEVIRMTLSREEGTLVTDVEMSVKEARKAIRAAGVVTLLVPTVRLAPGECRLEVLYSEDEADTLLLESHFKVVLRK